MNKRKPVDYTAMYTALDTLLQTDLPEAELYFEIGRAVCARPEKGAAVMAAEYLLENYPGGQGLLSPEPAPDAGVLPFLCRQFRTAGDGPAPGLDAECGHPGGLRGQPRTRLVSSGRTGVPLDQGGAAGANPGRSLAAGRTRRTGQYLLY